MHRGIPAYDAPVRWILKYGERYDDLVEHDVNKTAAGIGEAFDG